MFNFFKGNNSYIEVMVLDSGKQGGNYELYIGATLVCAVRGKAKAAARAEEIEEAINGR